MSSSIPSAGIPSAASLYAAKSWFFSVNDTPQETKAKEALQQFYNVWNSTPDSEKQTLLEKVKQGVSSPVSEKTDKTFKKSITKSNTISFPIQSNINGKDLAFLFQHTRDIKKLKVVGTNLDPNDLVQSIQNLKLSSPDIEEINLTGFTLTKDQFQSILSAFPYLKKLNMLYADAGTSMTPQEYFDVILPWISNNSRLESFGPLPSTVSTDQINQLVAALPATVSEIVMAGNGLDSTPIDTALSAISRKLGGGIYSLVFSKGGSSDVGFAKIVAQFPNLAHLRFTLQADIPNTFKDTILKYDPNQLKTLVFPGSDFLTNDLITILQRYPQEEINLRFWMPSDNNYNFSQVANLLVKQNCLKKIHLPDSFGLGSSTDLYSSIQALEPLLPQLEEFSIQYWDAFDDKTVLYLAQNIRNVKKFLPWFQSVCKWSDSTFPELFKALSKNSPRLEYLSFFNALNAVQNDVLLDGASRLPNLRVLDLSNNGGYLPDFVIPDVVKFVESCPNLEVINLTGTLETSGLNGDQITQLKNQLKKLRRDINVLG